MHTYNVSMFSIKGNIIFATELARRYGGEGIVSTSIHPGNAYHHFLSLTAPNRIVGIIKTDLLRHTGGLKRLIIVRITFLPAGLHRLLK